MDWFKFLFILKTNRSIEKTSHNYGEFSIIFVLDNMQRINSLTVNAILKKLDNAKIVIGITDEESAPRTGGGYQKWAFIELVQYWVDAARMIFHDS